MKKIFAVSFLSVLAVGTTTNAWANAGPNLNLATAEYVRGVENRLEDYVLESAVVNSQGKDWRGGDVTTQVEKFPDNYVPTIARMEAAIEEAVEGVDTSGLVDKAQVINSQGNNWNGASVAEAALSNPDDYVATDGAVQYRVSQLSNQVGLELQKKVAKDDIVTLAEDTAAAADMEAGTNDEKYDTVVPSYRTVYSAVNLLEAETEEGLKSKVDIAQGPANKNAIMITNAAGNVIPALVGDCANTTNKCALVTGVDESGNLVLQWEVIARNVVQPTE